MALIENITKKPRLKRETSPIDTSLWSDEAKQDFAKNWRDEELKKTDWICAIPDHGKMKPMKKKNGNKKVMGKRKKLDMDRDGKLTKRDFAMLRNKKKKV